MYRLYWLIPVLIALAVLGTRQIPASTSDTPAARVLSRWDGRLCGIRMPHVAIIKDAASWGPIWTIAQLGPFDIATTSKTTLDFFIRQRDELPPPPPFEPERAIGIALFVGYAGNGDSVQIDSMSVRDGRFLIEASVRHIPGPRPTMPEAPCLLLQIERPTMPIVVRARFGLTFLEVTDSWK